MFFFQMIKYICNSRKYIGKTKTSQLLLETLEPTTISRERDRTGFHLDKLPSAMCVNFWGTYYQQYTGLYMETSSGSYSHYNRHLTFR